MRSTLRSLIPGRLFVLAPLLVAVPLATGACGPSKVAECNALIDVINKGVEKMQESSKIAPDTEGTKELVGMADALDKVSADAAEVKLNIQELKDFSGKYQEMAKEVAKTARDLAAAASAEPADSTKIQKAKEALEQAVKKEDPIVDGINKFCSQP